MSLIFLLQWTLFLPKTSEPVWSSCRATWLSKSSKSKSLSPRCLDNSQQDQERHIKDLEEDLKTAKTQRVEALKERDNILTELDAIIRTLRRPWVVRASTPQL
jgi:hypothetical protein